MVVKFVGPDQQDHKIPLKHEEDAIFMSSDSRSSS